MQPEKSSNDKKGGLKKSARHKGPPSPAESENTPCGYTVFVFGALALSVANRLCVTKQRPDENDTPAGYSCRLLRLGV